MQWLNYWLSGLSDISGVLDKSGIYGLFDQSFVTGVFVVSGVDVVNGNIIQHIHSNKRLATASHLQNNQEKK